MSILIKNGLVVNHDEIFKADVLIKDDKIAQISPEICIDNVDEVIDANDWRRGAHADGLYATSGRGRI